MLNKTLGIHVLAVIVIAVFACILYGSTLNNDFIYNDHEMVGENSFIRSFGNIRHFFSDKYFIGSNEKTYRPFVTLTFLVDHSLWKDSPAGYHLTNLLFHAANGMLLYYMLVLLMPSFRDRNFGLPDAGGVLKRLTVPLLAALFFVSHPVETEGVISIGSRHDMVMAFFYFLAIICYLRAFPGDRERRGFYFSSLACYFLSMLSKEMGVTLPAVIILMDLMRPGSDPAEDGKGAVGCAGKMKYYAGYAVVASLYLYIRFFGITHPLDTAGQYYGQTALAGGNYYSHVLTAICGLGTYLRLLVFPMRLSLEYPVVPASSILTAPVVVSAAAVAAIAFGAVRLRQRYSLVSFGWAWAGITILPVSNIFVILLSTQVSERFLYLPAAGYCIFLASALYAFSSAGKGGRKLVHGAVVGIITVILCFYSARTFLRAMDWQDSRTFWEAAARTERNSFRTHNNLARSYFYDDKPEKAIEELNISLGIRDSAQTRVNLAFIYFEQGRYEEAEEELRKAISLQPGYASAYYHLALIRLKEGKDDEALELLMGALGRYSASKERPFHAETYNITGMVLHKKGLYDQAIEKYKAALEIDPGYVDARYLLAKTYISKKMFVKAEAEYLNILMIAPDHVDARNNLANLYYARGLADKAVEEYGEVLRKDPSHFRARNNLANIYLSRGEYDKAIAEYLKVIKAVPGNAAVHYNLGLAYAGKKMYAEAKKEWEEALRMRPGMKAASKALKDMKEGRANAGR